MDQRWVPPAIAPPKGLTGILEGYAYEPGSVLDTSSFPDNMVLLNVYDVSDSDLFTRINKVTTANDNILWGGVFHAGVEIYRKEWCYGVTEYGRTGVCAVDPRSHPQHTYRCTVPMGVSKITNEDVETLLRRLAQEWPGHEYDLIHHNCISFCNALLSELLPGGRVPGWVDRAMRTAGFIDLTSKKVMEETQNTVQLVKTLSTDLEQKARSLSTMEASEVLEVTQKRSEELASQASGHLNVLHGNLLEWGEGLRSSAERGLEDNPEVKQKAELVRRKTKESLDEIGEKASAFGASLWSWGQGLQGKIQSEGIRGLADEASNLQASVTSFVEGPSSSMSTAPATQISSKGLLDEDDDMLLQSPGDRSSSANMGLIRSVEDRHLKQGLLAADDSDEDDESVDLIGVAAALKENGARSGSAPGGYVTEAPAQASTVAASSSQGSSAPEPADAPGGAIWDLLTPQDSNHVTYGQVEQPSTPWFEVRPGDAPIGGPPAKAPVSVDPLDGVDLLN